MMKKNPFASHMSSTSASLNNRLNMPHSPYAIFAMSRITLGAAPRWLREILGWPDRNLEEAISTFEKKH